MKRRRYAVFDAAGAYFRYRFFAYGHAERAMKNIMRADKDAERRHVYALPYRQITPTLLRCYLLKRRPPMLIALCFCCLFVYMLLIRCYWRHICLPMLPLLAGLYADAAATSCCCCALMIRAMRYAYAESLRRCCCCC